MRNLGFTAAGVRFLVWEEDGRQGARWAAELAVAEPVELAPPVAAAPSDGGSLGTRAYAVEFAHWAKCSG